MPLSPIKPTDEPPVAPPRQLRMPLDPMLTLAVVGIAVCSIVTLGAATQGLVPGRPNYYVNRQLVYLMVGVVGMVVLSRVDYARLRQFKNGIYALLILSILAVLALGHAARGSQRATLRRSQGASWQRFASSTVRLTWPLT